MSGDHHLPEYLPFANMHVTDMQQHQHLHQPQPHHYPSHYPVQHQPQTLGDAGASSAYELTAAAASATAASAAAAEVGSVLLHLHGPHERSASQFVDYRMIDQQDSSSERSQTTAASTGGSTSSNRKRKTSSYGTASSYDEQCSSRYSAGSSDKKQNHSEIEKRRRDKMNTYISELSSLVPMCGALPRKLDKLSVLRLAVAHLREVRGALNAAGALPDQPRAALLPQEDLNALLLHVARAQRAFLVVLGCDGGRLLFASHSVHAVLHYHHTELVGQSLFDFLHPKDVHQVKEQLTSSDISPRERLIDAKTMMPVRPEVVSGPQRLSPGARRSFFCRIKCKPSPDKHDDVTLQQTPSTAPPGKEDGGKHEKKRTRKYCVVQCTGYLKLWRAGEAEGAQQGEAREPEERASLTCLVAMCRAMDQPPDPHAPLQFGSRHAVDGKFLFVDQRVRLALGYLPQELLGTSLYEYVTGAELGLLARAHKQALIHKQALHTEPYPFRRKDGSMATIQTHFKPFSNPWTKDVDCLVANNTLVPDKQKAARPSDPYKQTEEWRAYLVGGGGGGGGAGAGAGERRPAEQAENESDMAQLITSQVESHKIGACIAQEARGPSPPPQAQLLHDPVFSAPVDSRLGMGVSAGGVPLGVSAGGAPSPAGAEEPLASPPPLPLDGNSEAAMAVIMSLLEADAGLGGPINFNTFPWNLP